MAKKVTKKVELETKAAVETATGLDVNSVISEIGTLQVGVQNTLANLSANITSKLGELDQVNKAIEAKRTELNELYSIETEAQSLEEMRARHEAEEVEWEKRRQTRQEAWSDDETERRKKWLREEEEYNYTVAQRNQRTEEEHKALIAKNQRDEQVRQEMLNRTWQDRESALKAQETEVAEIKAKLDSFDARVKAEVDKGVAIITNQMKRQYEQEVVLLKKDMESAQKLNAAEVASLNKTISSLSDQLDNLQQQLEAARKDAKDITNAALAAGSQKEAFTALQRVVDTGSTPSGGKAKMM